MYRLTQTKSCRYNNERYKFVSYYNTEEEAKHAMFDKAKGWFEPNYHGCKSWDKVVKEVNDKNSFSCKCLGSLEATQTYITIIKDSWLVSFSIKKVDEEADKAVLAERNKDYGKYKPLGIIYIVIFSTLMFYKLATHRLHFWNLLFYFIFILIGILVMLADSKITQEDIDNEL